MLAAPYATWGGAGGSGKERAGRRTGYRRRGGLKSLAGVAEKQTLKTRADRTSSWPQVQRFDSFDVS